MDSKAPVIGIDASRAVGRVRTGTENYSAQLIKALLSEPTDYFWRLYFNGNNEGLRLPHNERVEIRDIPSRRLWTHNRLSRELFRNRITGLFVPAHVVPAFHPPTVVTIHDLGYLHFPDAHPAGQRRMLDLTSRWSAKTARHIIVPSQQTAADLIEFYKVPQSKISVVHHGIDPDILNQPKSIDDTFRERNQLNRPYVLAVGTIHPRKNLSVLAQAMADVVHQNDVDLVIAGRKGWMYELVEQELLAANIGDRLRLLDYVPSEDLLSLYQNAEVFVQPSKFEGFGMPVLEAMACGVPVVAAKGSSLDEIGGSVAIRFEHDDPETLANEIHKLLSDADYREKPIYWGMLHATGFTWEQSAHKTRIILEENLLN